MQKPLRDIAIDIAIRFLGKPYIWGGDDPIRGFDCCLPTDTMVLMSNNGYKKIQDVKPNDKILAYEDGHLVNAYVNNVFDNGIKNTIEIRTANNRIACTTNHPFLVFQKGIGKSAWEIRKNTKLHWIEADNITTNDYLVQRQPRNSGTSSLHISTPYDLVGLSEDFTLTKIRKITKLNKVQTWNLETNTGTFVAEGLVVHNSGAIIETLKSVGCLPRNGDWTAQGLFDLFKFKGCQVDTPYKGCLVFWGNRDKTRIIHIEMCINNDLTLGASGGGSRTNTQADAISQNAYIKIRPWRTRNRIIGFMDPFIKIDHLGRTIYYDGA